MTKDEIYQVKQSLVSGMKSYIEIFTEENTPEPYSYADADRCGGIIDDYLAYLFTSKRSNDEILSQVEVTVKALNKLNEKCGYSLIETDERENLCSIIIEAARLCGYQFPDDDDDITYEWRDW